MDNNTLLTLVCILIAVIALLTFRWRNEAITTDCQFALFRAIIVIRLIAIVAFFASFELAIAAFRIRLGLFGRFFFGWILRLVTFILRWLIPCIFCFIYGDFIRLRFLCRIGLFAVLAGKNDAAITIIWDRLLFWLFLRGNTIDRVLLTGCRVIMTTS